MINFKDFENEIKSFDNKLTSDEQNLYIEYIKNLDFLENQDPQIFIDNLIINDTFIENCKDFKNNEIPASAIVCKYKNLFLINSYF